MRVGRVLALLVAAAAPAAHAQTMLDQELRLIDIHDLLLELPPLQAPGALRSLELALSLEGISIPSIDGQTGGKRQITASDHTPVFPRPRLMLGLPTPEGFRAFVGASYVPPVTLLDVSTHLGGLEAGIAYAPGPLSIGVRAHAVYAWSRAPVTDPATRDTLESFLFGGEVSAGWRIRSGGVTWTPYAGAGVTRLHGRFRVTSDGVILVSDATLLALHGGVRVLAGRHWEAVAELDAYPGRLVHPNFRLGYVFDLR